MNNRNFAVGLFVAVALALFISATIWLTGKQGSEPTVNYSMFFEKDVGGLMLGGPVFYLGVEVGSVTAMNIIPGNPVRVRVDARVLKSAPVNSGTYASLAFQGITGVAVIKLYAESGQHEALQVGEDSPYAVIKVRDTGFSALLAKAPEIIEKLNSVLEQIDALLGEDNRELVNNVLTDISGISSALALQKETISELPVLLKASLEQVNSSLAQLKSMAVKLEPGLVSSVNNLEQLTGNLELLTERMEAWTATNDAEVHGFMAEGLGQVPDLITEAQVTLRDVQKLIRDLREDPSTLIYRPNEDAREVEK